MSDSRDLLHKADALLGRYRADRSDDEDVPILTEVVELPFAGERPERPHAPPGKLPEPPPAKEIPPPEELRRLEKDLRDRVLASLELQLQSALDEPLRARLDDHLRRALAALTAQVKADIDELLREAVGRAVKSEIERLTSPPGDGA